MPMWGYSWGGPWGGFGWLFPLIGLVFMVIMGVMCLRRMGGRMGCGSTGGRGPTAAEVAELHREVRELKDEIQRLRTRS